MSGKTIKSKGGSLFHPMVSVILFICCVPLFSSGNYLFLSILGVAVLITWFMDKTLVVDIDGRKFKESIFSTSKALAYDGYLSLFTESSGMKLQARSQSTVIKNKEVCVLHIAGKDRKKIVVASSFEEAEAAAIQLHDAWKCGVYNSYTKEWIREDNH
jgi:hypothetical protein